MMNPFLAEMYGTSTTIGANTYNPEVEKLAEAQALEEILASEGVNIDNLHPQTIMKVAAAVFGPNSALLKVAEEKEHEEEESKEKEETEEKMAEADFLGRMMAHSYVNELANIEKEAGVKDWATAAGKKAKEFGSWVASPKKRYSEAARMAREGWSGKGSIGKGEMFKMDKVKAFLGAAKQISPELAGAGAIGGGGYAAYRHHKKK